MIKKTTLIYAIITSLMLFGCGDTGKILGLEKKAPDEFLVVTNAPLSMPPNFNIRPPKPGQERSSGNSPTEQAELTVFGETAGGIDTAKDSSAGDLAILTKTGALDANIDIRKIVDKESSIMAVEDDGLVDDLLFWQDKKQSGTMVDANSEQQRLQENSGLGKPVTDGDTPMIRKENKGFFGALKWPF